MRHGRLALTVITKTGDAFAHLLRYITTRRALRSISHKVHAIWAASGTSEGLSYSDIHERCDKLPRGDA
jgi:hypothetical protein